MVPSNISTCANVQSELMPLILSPEGYKWHLKLIIEAMYGYQRCKIFNWIVEFKGIKEHVSKIVTFWSMYKFQV